jgi:Tfp pilus assembly protein PilF
VIAAARSGKSGNRRLLHGLIKDREQPSIARATALSLLSPVRSGQDLASLQVGLSAADPLLRLAAVRATEGMPAQLAVRRVSPLLRDFVRGVRIAAAAALARYREDLAQARQNDFERAARDYVDAQLASAEMPEAQLNLGNFYRDLGETKRAIATFRHALRLDPEWAAARVNLAELYERTGESVSAREVLYEGLKREPDNAPLNHALGLALVRDGKLDAALERLARAADLAPASMRFQYVYAIALRSQKDSEAISLLESMHEKAPANFDVLFALATIHRDAGDLDRAVAYAQALAVEYPDAPEVMQLLLQLQALQPAN